MNNFENVEVITREILNSCGGQSYLHIGSGNGKLVQELLSVGMDAYGVDQSAENVAFSNGIMPERFTHTNFSHLPFNDRAIDTTIALFCLENINSDNLPAVIKEISRVTRRSLYLRISTLDTTSNDHRNTTQDRNAWEGIFFEEGFRKHPSYYFINDYETLGRESGEVIILLERVSENALTRYPLEALKEERDLHMDMTREPGERSDAHIARYQWAASFVRPGDTVLDAACGLGYGSYLIQCGTMAKQTIGIDGSDYAIDYANTNFAPEVRNLSFIAGMLPEALYGYADNSVDVVISFETLEHIPDPEGVLKEFQRILTPGGRVIVSVPNDWSDETGEDPNPFHLHVYTLDTIRNQINTHFDIENVTVQSATHYKKKAGSKEWVPAKREIYSIDANINELDAPPSEWWLAVGMKSPLTSQDVSYQETQHKTYQFPEWNVTAFTRDYKNPWLVRSMVDIGWRQKNSELLAYFADQSIISSPGNSADVGAALCVQGYQLLSEKIVATYESLNVFSERIDNYINSKPTTPHAIRWTISLRFVMAKLWLKSGLHEKAIQSFNECVAIDPLQFSPLLANRIVESYLYLGILNLNAGDVDKARKSWEDGIYSARRAVIADWRLSLGDLNNPVEFGLPELTTVLDFASNCAYALANIDSFKDKPWWWLQVSRSPHAQANAIKALNSNLNKQLSTLGEYTQSLETTVKELRSQLGNEHVLRLAKQNKILRLRDVIENHPWSIRKALHIAYICASLITPQPLRNKLRPITNWLRSHVSGRMPFASARRVATDVMGSSGAYNIKTSAARAGAPRVAHVIANFMTGGSSRLVADIAEHLGHDYEHFVLTSYAPNPPAYVGLSIDELRVRNDVRPFIKYFKRMKPEFIHVHYWGDVDEPWYAQAIEAAKVLDIPVIENVNTPIAPYISPAIKRYIYVSDYVRHAFGKPENSHVTVYPGSDFSLFTRKEGDDVAKDCVGMVYRLENDKLNEHAIEPFIEIALKRPQTKVLIVGGGSLLESFKRSVQKAGVESQFEFTGYVDYDKLPDYYRRMSVFIAPVWKESFGQVSPFAMNMHVPVIGYDVGAISEIVNSKAMLAPAGDASKLADIAIELLENDELRASLGCEHQQRAEELFSVQAMISSYARLYSEMVKK
ncbi:methyltransferase domain-containing protein (plasmid) [Citrobacter freundii]|nr:methyltransferase domain-containing protein [Citrobacter freundii]QLO06797.1 methyltransferase domain-containing protein [Citrobacter freundii]